MPSVMAYHRPSSLEEARTLLEVSTRRAIGGGTAVVPAALIPGDEGVEVVDLQGLDLGRIEPLVGDKLRLGAMVRLQELVDDERVPTLLRDLAKRETSSALRNQATVGGTVALGAAESVLVAGLLVHGAVLEFHGTEDQPLAGSLADCVGQRLVTAVVVETAGEGTMYATGRTPADVPIVAAVGRLAGETLSLALTGVGSYPVSVDPTEPVRSIEPLADFRGSAEYRTHLAEVLSGRVRADLEGER